MLVGDREPREAEELRLPLVPAADEADVRVQLAEQGVDHLGRELVLEIALGARAPVAAQLVDREPVGDDGVVATSDELGVGLERPMELTERGPAQVMVRVAEVGERLVDGDRTSVELDVERPHDLLVEREPRLECAHLARGERALLGLGEDVGREPPDRTEQVARVGERRRGAELLDV